MESSRILTLREKKILNRLLSFRKIVDGHWIFNGSLNIKGYGNFSLNGKPVNSHRLSAFLHGIIESLDSPLQVLHNNSCNYKSCFNPECLRAGTAADNTQDSIDKGTKFHPNKGKLICNRGHPLSGNNAKKDSRGFGVSCRECILIKQRERRAKERKKNE